MKQYTMIIAGIVASTTFERIEGIFGIDRLIDVLMRGEPILALISYAVPLFFGGVVLAVLKSLFHPAESGVVMALLMGLGFGLIHLLFLPDPYRERPHRKVCT